MRGEMVMIHGMWGGPWCWEHWQAYMEERGWRCHVPCLRHHDVSPDQPPRPELGRLSLLDYAADLQALIRDLDEPPVIVGHSMGGLLAQMLAARGLAKAAVCLTPASPRGVLALEPSVIRTFLPVLTTWGFWRKPVPPDRERAIYGVLHLTPEPELSRMLDNMVHESGRAVFEIGMWLFDGRRANEVRPEAVSCPMLVVGAKEDRIVPAKVVAKTAKHYGPRAEHWELDGHAHWVLGEPGWEDIAGRVDGWLQARAG